MNYHKGLLDSEPQATYRPANWQELRFYRRCLMVLVLGCAFFLAVQAFGQGSLSAGVTIINYTDPSSGFVLSGNINWSTTGAVTGTCAVTNTSGLSGRCTVDVDGATGFTNSFSGSFLAGSHYWNLSYSPPDMHSPTVTFSVNYQYYTNPFTIPENDSPQPIIYYFSQGGTVFGSYSQPVYTGLGSGPGSGAAFTSSMAAPSAFPDVTVSTSQSNIFLPNGSFDGSGVGGTNVETWTGSIPIASTGSSSGPVTTIPGQDAPQNAPGTPGGPALTLGGDQDTNIPIWTSTTSTVGLDLTNFQTATDQTIRDENANTKLIQGSITSASGAIITEISTIGGITNSYLSQITANTATIAANSLTTSTTSTTSSISAYTISISNNTGSLASTQQTASTSAGTFGTGSTYSSQTSGLISTISSAASSSFSSIVTSSLSDTQENVSSATTGNTGWPTFHFPILGDVVFSPYNYPSLMNILFYAHDIILVLCAYMFTRVCFHVVRQYTTSILSTPNQNSPVAAEDLVPVIGNIVSRTKRTITAALILSAVIVFYGGAIVLINSKLIAMGGGIFTTIQSLFNGGKFAQTTASLQGTAAWSMLNQVIPMAAMWQFVVAEMLLEFTITPLYAVAAFIARCAS